MREMIARFSEVYRTAQGEEKRVVVDQVIKLLQEGSVRFLARREDGWYEVASAKRAVEKVELALWRSSRCTASTSLSCPEVTIDSKRRRLESTGYEATNLSKDDSSCLPSC